MYVPFTLLTLKLQLNYVEMTAVMTAVMMIDFLELMMEVVFQPVKE